MDIVKDNKTNYTRIVHVSNDTVKIGKPATSALAVLIINLEMKRLWIVFQRQNVCMYNPLINFYACPLNKMHHMVQNQMTCNKTSTTQTNNF